MTEDVLRKDNPICGHIGARSQVIHTVIVVGKELWTITNQNCLNCGKVFTEVVKIPLPRPEEATDHIMKPPVGFITDNGQK